MEYPIKLAKIRGISLQKATEFAKQFQSLKRLQDSMIFLQDLGITINLALKIYNHYLEKCIDIVRTNPYQLVDDIDGVGFTIADRIGANLGIKKDSEFRIEAAIAYCLKKTASISGKHNSKCWTYLFGFPLSP